MTESELLPPAILQRKAVVYVRQSTQTQVEANTEGRICLCNALFASAGLGQRRPGGLIEPPLVTSGEDLSGVAALLTAARGGTVDSGEFGYTARDVVDYLLS